MLVLQNCVSPLPEICQQVGNYQSLTVSPVPSTEMSVEVIEKLRTLVLEGATIVGAPPKECAGLKDYPNCDRIVQRIAAEMWGNLDGKTKTVRNFGKGRIVWGRSPRQILEADNIPQDFSYSGQSKNPEDLDYIHRTLGNEEIYFIINRNNQPTTRECIFRVSGRQPEILDPVSGIIDPANDFRQSQGCTIMPLSFDRYGSYFVVFRKPIRETAVGKSQGNSPKLAKLQDLDGPWNVSFDPHWGGPSTAAFPELVSWTQRSEDGIKYYSGKATYHKTFDLVKEAGSGQQSATQSQRLYLDLGDVRSVAEVRLNGKKLGILWCSPWRMDITNAVKPTGNVLEVDVINLWANRVIHDLNLPKDQRLTKTHEIFRFDEITGSTPLIESGLLGPVSILTAPRSDDPLYHISDVHLWRSYNGPR
jgi:hypothetical protein